MYRSILDNIRNKTDITEVIARSVKLKKQGRNYIGLCPFHSEKTPSFSVSPSEGLYYCFGCGSGGDVFKFLMLTQNYSFMEVVSHLAKEVGIVIKSEKIEQEENFSELFSIMDKSREFFRESIYKPSSSFALNYLYNRGLTDIDIKEFGLGWAPKANEQMKFWRQFDKSQLALLGLMIGDNKDYPKFRERIMFPILTRGNQTIAFGGRSLGEALPKYLNSPDNKLFHKRYNLYGQEKAFEHIRKGSEVIVAEGYIDIIALHKAGFKGAIAPLGTSLTEEQALLIVKRACNNIYLCFDGDKAGIMATSRALKRLMPFLKSSTVVKIVKLPANLDPDTIILKSGQKKFAELLQQSVDMFEFLWAEVLEECKGFKGPAKSARASKLCKDVVEIVKDEHLKTAIRQYFRDKVFLMGFKSKVAKKNNNIIPILSNKDLAWYVLVFAPLLSYELVNEYYNEYEQIIDVHLPGLNKETSYAFFNYFSELPEEIKNNVVEENLGQAILKILEDDSFKSIIAYSDVYMKLKRFVDAHMSFLSTITPLNVSYKWHRAYQDLVLMPALKKDLEQARRALEKKMNEDNWKKLQLVQAELNTLQKEL